MVSAPPSPLDSEGKHPETAEQAMEQAIAASELQLDAPAARAAALAAELAESKATIARMEAEAAGALKAERQAAEALEMYKGKCEALKEARSKVEERSNAKIDMLQAELDEANAAAARATRAEESMFSIVDEAAAAEPSPVEEPFGRTQQLNIAHLGAEVLLNELQASKAQLADRQQQLAGLETALREAKEDADSREGELVALREARDEQERQLAWQQEQLPDMAAASESYLLLQARHDALGSQLDRCTADLSEQSARVAALEGLVEVKDQTMAQMKLKAEQDAEQIDAGQTQARGLRSCLNAAEEETAGLRAQIERMEAELEAARGESKLMSMSLNKDKALATLKHKMARKRRTDEPPIHESEEPGVAVEEEPEVEESSVEPVLESAEESAGEVPSSKDKGAGCGCAVM